MTCYRSGGCGPYENRPCNECPASHPTYASYRGGRKPPRPANRRQTRAQLRGKPLDEDCRKIARSDSGQYGPQDRRCYCTGIWDPMHEDILPKCRECKAWNNNAEPPEEGRP